MGYKGSRTNIDSVVPLRREYVVVAARERQELLKGVEGTGREVHEKKMKLSASQNVVAMS